jgi:CrcB protein
VEDLPAWLQLMLRNKFLLLMLGGGLGTCLRYLVTKWFESQLWGQEFPLATLVINVTGSFVLATVATILLQFLPPGERENWYLFVCTGLCGGYTTFSTFEWETYNLVRDGSWWFALLNIFASVLAGFVAVFLGVKLVALIFPRT